VTPDVVVVAGSDPAGTFYGIQSLVQILAPGSHGRVTLPALRIRDWPAMKWRGMAVEGAGTHPEDLRRVIRNIAARYKMNVIIAQSSYRGILWKSHPEITPDGHGVTLDEYAQEAQYARNHFLHFVPGFESLGHVGDVLAAHPEIAELPDLARKGQCSSYCPSNPETYRILFDMWKEIVDAVHPHYFLAGHDEVDALGQCALCKGKTHAALFAGDVVRLDDWLKAHGVRMMIWGDMLLNRAQWLSKGPYAANGDTTEAVSQGTDAAIDLIPKDVVLCDWQYSPMPSYDSQAYFVGKGFQVLGCPWYSQANNFNMAESASKNGILGLIVTDWGFLATSSVGATSLLGPAYAWNPGRPPLGQLPYVPTAVLGRQFRPMRPSDVPGARFVPLDIGAQASRRISCRKWGDHDAWFGDGPGSDLWMLHGGRQKLGGIDFRIPEGSRGAGTCVMLAPPGAGGFSPSVQKIAVNLKADSLVLLTGLQVDDPGVSHDQIATLMVHYQDGALATMELQENLQVTDWRTFATRANPWHWSRGYAELYGAKPVFQGLTRFGQAINLQACEWVNPHPEKRIAALDLQVARGNDQGLLLAVLAITAVENAPQPTPATGQGATRSLATSLLP
jgi:hypothetical protein